MLTKAFWRAAAERAIKTAAQTVLTMYFVGDVAFNAIEADWLTIGSFAAGGAIFSILTSLVSGSQDGNPSATNAETVTTGRHSL